MKIAVIGATGRAGARILAEAKNRNHEVTALVRSASKLGDLSVPSIEKDIYDLTSQDLTGFDAIVSAFGTAPGQEHLHSKAAAHLVSLLKSKDKPRLLVVGGAGSLFVDDHGTRLFTTPQFPKEYYPTAKAQCDVLLFLEKQPDVNWTFLSPAAFFEPGQRTAKFRLGKNHLLADAQGKSYITMEDYAIAMVDEIETPKHIRQRFTVAY